MTGSYTKILGVGAYLPQEILTNHHLGKIVNTSDELIFTRSGIKQRHIAAPDETSSSMGLEAAKKALEMANLPASEIDMIIVATCSPDMLFPSAACFLQRELNLPGIPAFDLTAACSGFVYALSVADQFIRTGQLKTILVVGSEVISRAIDWQDRSTCVLFGDGAGAMIVQASSEHGIRDIVLHSDGRYIDILNLPSPYNQKTDKKCYSKTTKFEVFLKAFIALFQNNNQKVNDKCYLQMQGREVFRTAVTELHNTVKELLERNHINIDSIDWLVPHQANSRIIKQISKSLEFPIEKVIMTVAEHANTSSASVPLAFNAAVCDGRIKRGDSVIIEAFGGGLTWGGIWLTF